MMIQMYAGGQQIEVQNVEVLPEAAPEYSGAVTIRKPVFLPDENWMEATGARGHLSI